MCAVTQLPCFRNVANRLFCALHEDYPIHSDLALSEVGTNMCVCVCDVCV